MAINLNFLLILSLFSLAFLHPTLALKQSFTTKLIHRESPLSPLSDSYLNKYDRLRNSIRRSISHVNRFKTLGVSSPNDVQARVIPAAGEYVMELSLGTPPVKQLAIADTGSDLIWLQCQPCLKCYTQDIPIFDPRKSSTFKTQSCDSQACQELSSSQSSCSSKNVCQYLYQYGDQSHTSGDIATETVTFNSGDSSSKGTSFPNINIGCGYDNEGTFRKDGSGLIGLGGGPLSLVSQLGSSIDGTFSYCLISFFEEGNYTSTINFGSNGRVTGPGVISTPLVKSEPDTFYFLSLKGVSVGNTKIPFSKKTSKNDEGNVIIDSGTTLTLLPSDIYEGLESAIKSAIHGEEVEDPTGNLNLCYKSSNGGADLNIPDVTAQFDGGDVVWKPVNTFLQVAEEVVCLAIVPADDQPIGGIIGNVAQVDFLIGYDTQQGKLSFKPTDCTKH